ncbi:MAG: GTP cyclohydrolase I FolE [Rubrobacteraceae bacterium]
MSDVIPDNPAVDKPRIERAVREILAAIGDNPDREGVLGTPRRVAEAYEYLFSGLGEDPTRHLEIGFAEDYGNVVIVRDIYLASMCEHHLLPFIGKAHLAYIPKDRVVGLSKLARLVEGYARRPQLQERLTAQIAAALYDSLDSRGALVVIEADHSCMTMRGVQKPGSITVTSATRGLFEDEPARRAEALALIHQGGSS